MPRTTLRELPQERLAIRLLAIIITILMVLITIEAGIDLWRTGKSLSDLSFDTDAGRSLASTASRAMTQLMAMVLTFIALAIPITANMYTPKLIEIFLRDPLNLAALLYFSIAGAHSIFGQAVMVEAWNPGFTFAVLTVMAIVGYAVLIPYYFYVLHFLNPSTIIARVTDQLLDEFEDIRKGVRPVPIARRRLHQKILHLGNVILRAVERADRDVSLDAIHALERVLARYCDLKPHLKPEWFDVEPDLFVGLSEEAVRFIVRDRIWVEHKGLSQLTLGYNSALAKMQDAISAISDVDRAIALHALEKGDEKLLDLCVRFFNTFIREAVKKKDVHALYDLFYQYKLLARQLLRDRPRIVLDIGRYFKYYGEFARLQGLSFIYELTAYELGSMVEWAYDAEAETRRDLLALFLSFEAAQASIRLTKAAVILGAYFADTGREAESKLVREALGRHSPSVLDEAKRSLMETTEPIFWEVTDRQLNFDYVDPARRATVGRLVDEIVAGLRGGVAAKGKS